MSDKVYEEFNNINFNETEFNFIEDSLTEVEIKKLKKSLKKKVYKTNKKHFKIAASIALVGIIGFTLITPAFAETIAQNIPFVDTLYERLGYYKDYKDFSQYIGLSKEIKGYKFTIDKFIADEHTVLVALRINKAGLNEKVDEDGKSLDFIMNSDLSGTNKGTIMSGSVNSWVIDEDNSIVILENKTAPEKSLPKRFDMKVNIHSMADKDINISFDLPVSREKMQKEILVKKELRQSAVGENLKIKLHEISASPLNTDIKYSFEGKLKDNQFIEFYAYDDKGRIYLENSGGADDSGYRMSSLNRIEQDAKKLYIIPYIEVQGTSENYMDKYKNPDFYNKYFSIDTKKEFDFKEDGKVNVYKIEKSNNSIKFYYSLKGFQSTLNKRYIINLQENNNDKQENMKGIFTKNMRMYKVDANEGDNYCIEFYDIDTSKDYVYSINFFSTQKVIEGTPIEVILRK